MKHTNAILMHLEIKSGNLVCKTKNIFLRIIVFVHFLIIDDLTKRLITSHPEQADVIIEKQQIIQNQWTDLTSKADLHKV